MLQCIPDNTLWGVPVTGGGRNMRKLCSMLGLLGLAVAAGCDGDGSSRDRSLQPPAQTGTVVVSVTDQPIPADCFTEASVTINRIEIFPVGVSLTGLPPTTPTSPTDTGIPTGPTGTAFGALEPPNTGTPLGPDTLNPPPATQPVVIDTGSATFNLLDLRGGQTEQVAVATVPVGTYDRVRIFLE